MVIDTSALTAILFDEDEAPAFEQAIASDPVRLISAATWLEAVFVAEGRFGEPGGRELDLLIHKARIEVVPFSYEHGEAARSAFRRFGKGRHRAGLNLGDCFAYALSKVSGEALLFKGNDFAHTDVVPVPTSAPPG